jgi:hypothetical protein
VKKKVFGKRFEKRQKIDEISGDLSVFLTGICKNGRNGMKLPKTVSQNKPVYIKITSIKNN